MICPKCGKDLGEWWTWSFAYTRMSAAFHLGYCLGDTRVDNKRVDQKKSTISFKVVQRQECKIGYSWSEVKLRLMSAKVAWRHKVTVTGGIRSMWTCFMSRRMIFYSADASAGGRS